VDAIDHPTNTPSAATNWQNPVGMVSATPGPVTTPADPRLSHLNYSVGEQASREVSRIVGICAVVIGKQIVVLLDSLADGSGPPACPVVRSLLNEEFNLISVHACPGVITKPKFPPSASLGIGITFGE